MERCSEGTVASSFQIQNELSNGQNKARKRWKAFAIFSSSGHSFPFKSDKRPWLKQINNFTFQAFLPFRPSNFNTMGARPGSREEFS